MTESFEVTTTPVSDDFFLEVDETKPVKRVTKPRASKAKKPVEVPITIPRTKEALSLLVKETLAKKPEGKKGFWNNIQFINCLLLLRSKNPQITSLQRERLYNYLMVNYCLPLANKIIADRQFKGLDSWDLVQKMYLELNKYSIERGTSSYSYFYTVGIRQAFALTTLAGQQIVPTFMMPREEYSLLDYEANPSMIEKDGYITIQTTKMGKNKVRVWYQPINGILDIHRLYTLEEDELCDLEEATQANLEDTSSKEDHNTSSTIYSHITEDIGTEVPNPLEYYELEEEVLSLSPEEYLNSVKEEIYRQAKNEELALKSYSFFVWLNSQPNTARSEHAVWENFQREFKAPISRAERILIMHVLSTAVKSLG